MVANGRKPGYVLLANGELEILERGTFPRNVGVMAQTVMQEKM